MCLGDASIKRSDVQIEHDHSPTKNSNDKNNVVVEDSVISDTNVSLCKSTIEKTVNDYLDKTEGSIIYCYY